MTDVPNIYDPSEENLVDVCQQVKQTIDVREGRTRGADLNFVTLAELKVILRNLGLDPDGGFKRGTTQATAKAQKNEQFVDTDDQTIKMGV